VGSENNASGADSRTGPGAIGQGRPLAG